MQISKFKKKKQLQAMILYHILITMQTYVTNAV